MERDEESPVFIAGKGGGVAGDPSPRSAPPATQPPRGAAGSEAVKKSKAARADQAYGARPRSEEEAMWFIVDDERRRHCSVTLISPSGCAGTRSHSASHLLTDEHRIASSVRRGI